MVEDKRIDGSKEWGKCLHSLLGVGVSGGGIDVGAAREKVRPGAGGGDIRCQVWAGEVEAGGVAGGRGGEYRALEEVIIVRWQYRR